MLIGGPAPGQAPGTVWRGVGVTGGMAEWRETQGYFEKSIKGTTR